MTNPATEDIDIVNVTPPNKPHSGLEDADVKVSTPGEQLGITMEDAARQVRERADYLQHHVLLPIATKTRSFAEANPILFTFLTIFAALSFIPIVCFIGFVLTLTTLIIGGAAIFILLSTLGTVLFGASILLPILLISLTFSLLILGSLICAFLIYRLYLAIRANPENLATGINVWIDESKARVAGAGWAQGEGWIKVGKDVQHVRVALDEGDETAVETEAKHSVKTE